MKVGKQGIYREHDTIKARIIEAAPVQDHERERLDQQEDFVFDEDSQGYIDEPTSNVWQRMHPHTLESGGKERGGMMALEGIDGEEDSQEVFENS